INIILLLIFGLQHRSWRTSPWVGYRKTICALQGQYKFAKALLLCYIIDNMLVIEFYLMYYAAFSRRGLLLNFQPRALPRARL
ncbi:MAG: hypothetical protein ACOYOV_15765, partial [Bacteroidales bacterium]